MQANHKQTDPTYLRTIHDGLLLGAFHKDNASALPMGLVGMYEEALPPASNVNERKKFLKFFAVWALLKKEASVVFLMPLLEGWSEEIIIYYLNKYSKWFNSPQSGKYVLYHERLRAFILQKNSKQQFNTCNETIIKVSHDALSRRSGDEWENYALEYLSNHMLIPAIEKGDSSSLKSLGYDTTHWNRQVEISKGFEWSKRMLNNIMLWASKYDDNEVIECALNKVDLHHQEQNDAPRIVELVAQNDIETALDRIDKFGGQDKEGLQRKFILYMLCLMELTLLDSKDKPYRKEAIGKLLKHFDDNIRVDHSVLNWNDFFPSYLMFQIVCCLNDLDLDGLIIFKRTRSWDHNWIQDKGPYSNHQIKILIRCGEFFTHKPEKISLLIEISNDLFSKEVQKVSKLELKEARENLLKIIKSLVNEDPVKFSSLLYKIGKYKQSQAAMNQAKLAADSIKYPLMKSRALMDISIALAKQGKADEAFEVSKSISKGYDKVLSLKEIAVNLAGKGFIYKALEIIKNFDFDEIKYKTLLEILCTEIEKSNSHNVELLIKETIDAAMEIFDEFNKISSLAELSTLYSNILEMKMSKKCIDEAIKVIKHISNKPGFHGYTNNGFKQLSIELTKQGKISEAIKYIRKITDNDYKIEALIKNSKELYLSGKNKQSKQLINEALDIISKLKDNRGKDNFLSDFSIEFAFIGDIDQSLKKVMQISDQSLKSYTIKKISSDLVLKNGFECSINFFHEAIVINQNHADKFIRLKEISLELANQGNIKESIKVAKGINERQDRFDTLIIIYSELLKKELLNNALIVARCIEDDWKIGVLANLSTEFAKKGNFKQSNKLIQECIRELGLFNIELNKNLAYKDISIQLARQGKFSKAIEIVNINIEEEDLKRETFSEICIALARDGKLSKAIKLNQEIFNKYFVFDVKVLKEISIEFAKQGKLKKALKFVQDFITDIDDKIMALIKISIEETKYANVNKSIELVLQIVRGITNKYEKAKKYKAILTVVIEYEEKFEVDDILLELIENIRSFSDEKKKVNELIEVSKIVSNHSKSKDALKLIHEAFTVITSTPGCPFALSIEYLDNQAVQTYINYLINISSELFKLGELKESSKSIHKTYEIALSSKYGYAIKAITSEYAKREEWKNAEVSGLNIPEISERQDCWKKIAKTNLEKYNTKISLEIATHFYSNVVRGYYLIGWAENISINDVDSELLQKSICKFPEDITSLKTLLQKYAIHELFYCDTSHQKMNRFNRTLNMQWAIEIKNSFNAN